MVRQRKQQQSNSNNRPAKDGSHKPKDTRNKPEAESKWDTKFVLFMMFNFVLISSMCGYLYYLHYLESRVVTPLPEQKVITLSGLDIPERFWGSYRSGLYFGLQTRSPHSIVTGLMWFQQKLVNQNLQIRHWCNQWDGLKQYGWLKHDGVNFGLQNIFEETFSLQTSFVKRVGGGFGGDWTARISVDPRRTTSGQTSTPISIVFYIATDGYGKIKPVIRANHLETVHGENEEVGRFRVQFNLNKVSSDSVLYNYLYTVAPSLHQLTETVLRNVMVTQAKKGGPRTFVLKGQSFTAEDAERKRVPNFVAVQLTATPPFELDIIYESESFVDRPNTLKGEVYSSELQKHIRQFDVKFDTKFKLAEKGFTPEDIDIGKAVLSNLIGGIGYFYGSSLVQSEHNKEPVDYWKAALYTAVPSRSFFPRGFLWDEGFHNLLISQWNGEISKDILGHWLDLMNIEGWIPREQILGVEARSRVPLEFIVQKNNNANPPTIFLAFQTLLNQMKENKIPKDTGFLVKAFPRLKAFFNWFNTTQVGKLPGSYCWRGRDTETRREFNPKTLTSGLDDYPRASHPTEDERHLDLRCWMALASGILAEIATEIGEPFEEFAETHRYLTRNNLMDELHWSPASQSYSDYGLHTDNVKLVNQKPKPGQGPLKHKVRISLDTPTLRFVDHFGYVSLFPLLLHVIEPDNPKLGKVLMDLKNPDLLWTDYGLRSLSKKSPMYMKYNTDTDPPYWRGPIWININYLTIRALHHYSEIPGPYQQQAFELYKELRTNVMNNIIREYKRSNYVWENYNDKTGEGKGSHPFTGWSSLVLLLMGEVY